jgi:hypothetical protein
MPLDPSIILGAKPAQFDFAQFSPVNTLASAMKIKQLEQEGNLNALTLKQRTGLQDYLAGNPDLKSPETRYKLATEFGEFGRKVAESVTNIDKSKNEQLKQMADTVKIAGNMLAGITDDTGWQRVRPRLQQLDPSAQLPETYDPKYIAESQQEALGIEKALERHFMKQDAGSTEQVLSMRKYDVGNVGATVVPGSVVKKTATIADTLAREKFNFEKANPGYELKEAEDGSIVGVNKRTLQAFPVTLGGATTPAVAGGAPAAAPTALKGKGTALTESQGNATAYGMRMLESDKLLKDLEKSGITSGGRIKAAVQGTLTSLVPFQGENLAEGAGNVMNILPGVLGGPSESQQMYEQAKKNFITAVLRKESGAAIGASEFATEEKKYFPQAGESEKVIAQKQRARELAIQAMKIQAGPGSKSIGGGAAADPLGIR